MLCFAPDTTIQFSKNERTIVAFFREAKLLHRSFSAQLITNERYKGIHKTKNTKEEYIIVSPFVIGKYIHSDYLQRFVCRMDISP